MKVKTAQELGLAKLQDEELLRNVSKRGCLLITMDKDFLSDKKFPLHQRGSIIFVDGKNASIAKTDGFELLIVFLTSFGARWRGKLRASSRRVYIKFAGADGRKVLYEIAPIRPLIYAREVTEESL